MEQVIRRIRNNLSRGAPLARPGFTWSDVTVAFFWGTSTRAEKTHFERYLRSEHLGPYWFYALCDWWEGLLA